MNKAERLESRRLIKERNSLRSLLKEFGARLAGWDPGVTALLPGLRGDGYFGEALSFSQTEWDWLRPLLEELRRLRKADKKRSK